MEACVKERGILFSAPMVRAILEGRKTQTRRVMKLQPQAFEGGIHPKHIAKHQAPYIDAYCGEKKTDLNPRGMGLDWYWWTEDDRLGPHVAACPYGKPGDRLWVRETYAWPGEEEPMYRADPYAEELVKKWRSDPNYPQVKWIPSIHMPRIHSRILLEITDVRVQRLQDISEEDAKAEGVEKLASFPCITPWRNYRLPEGNRSAMNYSTPQASFMSLWDSINGLGSNKDNPWVWAITFKRVEAAERAA